MGSLEPEVLGQQHKPTIFVFINGGIPGLLSGIAVAEDGTVVAGHGSSNEDWVRHDMGVAYGSTWKHDLYEAKYPDGYKLEYVKNEDVMKHPVLGPLLERMNSGPSSTEGQEDEHQIVEPVCR